MLTGKCINPQLVAAVSKLGHGDKILIADGNYPLASKTGNAEKIWLGLKPGLPTVTDILTALMEVVNIEKAEVMDPGDGSVPEIFGEFDRLLGGIELNRMERYDFYFVCSQDDTRLAISSGETRVFSNILVTVGVA